MLLSALLLATVVQAAPTPPSTPRAFIVPTGRLMRIAPAQVSKDAAVAVLRTQGGCSVSSTIRYNIGR